MGKRKLTLLLILVTSINSYAVLLGECYTVDDRSTSRIFDNISFNWADWPFERWEMFDPVYNSDEGKTSIASSTTQGFDAFTAILTNGTSDLISHFYAYPDGAGAGQTNAEEVWLVKFVESYGVDFYGYDITEITQSIDMISINPISGGTNYSFEVMYRFYGELIPEPATLLLLTLGGLAIIKKRKA